MLTVLALFGPPGIAVAAGVRSLASAFPTPQSVSRPRLMLGVGLLLVPFGWFLMLASYASYGNALASIYIFIGILVAGFLAGIVLIVKPPRARRFAGVLVVVGYPLLLIAVVIAAILLQFGIFARHPHWH